MAEFPVGNTDSNKPIFLNLKMANRHGLVAGATGTGKTVTLQYLAEQFANAGVNVFTSDVKGDLGGMAFARTLNSKIEEKIKALSLKNYTPQGNPVIYWDLYGKHGHPLRTTLSEIGPLLLGRILDLNATQQGVLNAAFSYADDEGLLLLDLKDLRSLLEWMGKNASTLKEKYGNMSGSSLGAILRNLLTLNEAGGDVFFGEPAFNIENLFQLDSSGKGFINILDATTLVNAPRLYSTFLLWLLSELFENLPEVGDLDKPKLIFFFDEAHLLFNSAPKALVEKIEQMIRLIRSKGVGVFFVSQSPLDLPETVLGQLGNRVQHALRAFTPKDQKAVKTAAATLRKNQALNTENIITILGVGEALVSFLEESGTPSVVEKVKIYPPASRIGPANDQERIERINASPFLGVYEKVLDRESAFEKIKEKMNSIESFKPLTSETPVPVAKRKARETASEAMFKSAARSIGSTVGRQIVRGLLGTIFGKSR